MDISMLEPGTILHRFGVWTKMLIPSRICVLADVSLCLVAIGSKGGLRLRPEIHDPTENDIE